MNEAKVKPETVDRRAVSDALNWCFTVEGKATIDHHGYVTITDGMCYNSIHLNNQQRLPLKFFVTDSLLIRYGSLITLQGSPITVHGTFNCSHNQLTSLKYAPKIVDKNFICFRNRLTSLVGAPLQVQAFNCADNHLTSLEGSPKKVEMFICDNNILTSLEGMPSIIEKTIAVANNPLTSLKGLPESFTGRIRLTWNPNLPLLRLLRCTEINIDVVGDILFKYSGSKFSRSNVLQCQKELIQSGYEGNASW